MPSFKNGDRILIELQSGEVYEGSVQYYSSTSLELYDIHCQTTDTSHPGNLTFYRNEVVTVKLLKNINGNDGRESSMKIKMHPDEFHRLKQMTFDFVFMDIFGPRFDDAIKALSDRESVAVVGLASTLSRERPLSLLVLSDFKTVYIFDMFCLVHLRALAEILRSNFIVKVVHGGAALSDCLYNRYGVEMRNVFDTQIIHSMVAGKGRDNKTSLTECLADVFNFPESLLSAAVENIDNKVWNDRPIIKSEKIKAAQLVTYLLSLRDHLVQKILQDYTAATVKEYEQYRNASDVITLTKVADCGR